MVSIQPGARVGPYEIVSPLGAGGMGEVYRARDPQLGRFVAIKILPPDVANDSEFARRFEQEARSASLLNHPAIVTIYDVGREGSQPFLAMELIQGESLHRLLQRDAPLPVRDALDLTIRIADGLAFAHAAGVVHRDLKPDNLMIGSGGAVKILDFGLAKVDDPSPDSGGETAKISRRITQPGTILGTIGYMSPEQACGEAVDFRSDQFALGTILYEMLTGLRPFQRSTGIETMSAILREAPPPIQQINPKVPEPLCWVVERLLAKNREQRYADTRDLVRDLENIRQHLSTISSTMVLPGAPRGVSRGVRIGIGAFVLLAVLAGLAWLGRQAPRSTADVPEHKYLAVIPFRDLSGQADGQLFSDGVAETLSVRLAGIPGVQVMPPSTSASMLTDRQDIRKISRDLGANLILQGTVQRAGDQIRITSNLLRSADAVLLAAASVSGSASAIFSLEDELADRIVESLQLEVSSARRQTTAGLENSDDQEKYLKALGLLQRYEKPDAVAEAISQLSKVSDTAEGSALLHAARARAYLIQYNLTKEPSWADRALAEGERAAELQPDNPDVRSTIGELRLATGKTDRAIEEFRKALAASPDSPEATIGLAQAYDAKGQEEEAEKFFRRAIEIRPAFWGGYSRLGVFFARHGRLPEAAEMFRQVTTLTPDNARGFSQLGNVYLLQQKMDEALKAYSRSTELDPNSDALSNRAYCYYFLGRFSDAAASLQEAVVLSPRDFLLWLNLGDAYRWTRNERDRAAAAYGRAIALANESLRLNPNDAQAHAVLALSLCKMGDLGQARAHARQAVDLAPSDPTNLYAAAVVDTIAGDPDAARSWLDKAEAAGYPRWQIERDPEFAKLGFREIRPETRAGLDPSR